MKYDLLAIDIDGTLTNEHHLLDLDGVKAVRKAENAGIRVVLASGRTVQDMRALSQFIGTTGFVVAENGAVIYDRLTDTLEVEGSIENAHRAFKAIKRRFPQVELYTTLPGRLTEVVIKENIDPELLRPIVKPFGIKAVATGFAIHLMQDGVNKAKGLHRGCDKFGFELKKVVAIGDGANDVEMLAECGLGIAVANAVPELKAVADYVTSKPYGEGVVEVVEKLLNGEF